ncbi:hypothetical protein STEG23_025269 [Scotinomys teguina]
MPGVTVKPAGVRQSSGSFLKKSGKLKIPEWVDTVKLAKHKELAPCDENRFCTPAASTARHLYLRGGVEVDSMTTEDRREMVSGPATSVEAPRVWLAVSSKL